MTKGVSVRHIMPRGTWRSDRLRNQTTFARLITNNLRPTKENGVTEALYSSFPFFGIEGAYDKPPTPPQRDPPLTPQTCRCTRARTHKPHARTHANRHTGCAVGHTLRLPSFKIQGTCLRQNPQISQDGQAIKAAAKQIKALYTSTHSFTY